MMKNYNNLNLKTGELDLGAISHNQSNFQEGGSLRVEEVCKTDVSKMILKYDYLIDSINKTVNNEK